MKSKFLVAVLGLALLASLWSGCQKSASGGHVAVIDLDRIAAAMGWMDALQKGVQAAEADLRGQLDQLLRGNLKAIDDAKAQVAAAANLNAEQIAQLNTLQDPRDLAKLPLTETQRGQLLEVVNRANQSWQQALNSFQQTLQARRTSLVQSYREQIRPVAKRIAAERGMHIVLTPSDNLLYYDPQAVDITDQVIEELQKNLAQSPPAKK